MNEEQLCDKINRISKQVLLISEDVNDFINSSHAEYEITTCPPSFEDFIKLSDTEMYRNKSNEEDCTIEEYNIAPKAKPKPNLQQLEKERIKKEVENLKNFKNKLNEEINQLLKKRELEKEESISKAEKKSASSSHELEQKKLNKEVEKLKNYKKELNEQVVQLLKAKTDAEKRKKGKKQISKKINLETTQSDISSLVKKFKPNRSRLSVDKISNIFEQFSVSECTDNVLSSSNLSFGEIKDNFSEKQTNSADDKFNHNETILTKSKPYQNKSPWYQHFIKTLSQNTVLSGNSDVKPNGLVEKLTNLCFGQECLDENIRSKKSKKNRKIKESLSRQKRFSRELEKEKSISEAEEKSASSSHELEQKKLNKEVEKLKNYKKELNEEVVQLLKAKTDAEKRKKGKKHVSKKINSETTHSDTNSLVEKFKPTRSRFSDDKISNFFEQFSVSECTDKELSSSKLSFGEIEDNLMKLMKLLSSSQFSDRQTNSDDTKFNHKENILTKSKPYQNKSPWYQHFIKTLSQNTVLSGNSDVNPNGLVEKLTNLCFGQECLDENIQSKKSKKNRKIKESISRQNSKISRKIEMKSAQRNKNQELLMEMFRELVQKCDVILEDIDEVNSKKSESLIETSSSRNSNSYYNQSLNNQLQNDCSYNVDIETAKKAKNKHYKTMSDASKESSYSFKERENYWLDKQRRK